MPAGGGQRRGGRRRRASRRSGPASCTPGQPGQRRAHLDIAVAGLGRGRAHAEGHDAPGPRRRHRRGQRAVQRRHVADGGVGGHHPQHRVGVLLGHQQGGGGDRRGGVAAHRLQHDARRRPRRRAATARRPGTGAPGCTPRSAARSPRPAARQRGFLDQRAVGDQRPELLGEALARDRPQPRAGAAGQQHRHHGARVSVPDAGVGRFMPMSWRGSTRPMPVGRGCVQ